MKILYILLFVLGCNVVFSQDDKSQSIKVIKHIDWSGVSDDWQCVDPNENGLHDFNLFVAINNLCEFTSMELIAMITYNGEPIEDLGSTTITFDQLKPLDYEFVSQIFTLDDPRNTFLTNDPNYVGSPFEEGDIPNCYDHISYVEIPFEINLSNLLNCEEDPDDYIWLDLHMYRDYVESDCSEYTLFSIQEPNHCLQDKDYYFTPKKVRFCCQTNIEGFSKEDDFIENRTSNEKLNFEVIYNQKNQTLNISNNNFENINNAKIAVYNSSGMKIFTKNITQNFNITILQEIKNHNSGIYFFNLLINNEHKTTGSFIHVR